MSNLVCDWAYKTSLTTCLKRSGCSIRLMAEFLYTTRITAEITDLSQIRIRWNNTHITEEADWGGVCFAAVCVILPPVQMELQWRARCCQVSPFVCSHFCQVFLIQHTSSGMADVLICPLATGQVDYKIPLALLWPPLALLESGGQVEVKTPM